MFVLHFEISTSKDFLQLNNEVESEAVVDKFKAKKDLLDQMETLKNQLDFFEYQINKEMLSKNPGTMTIEALMISWEEQLHNIKGNLISLMQPDMNQQFIYLLGGNSKFLCDFYVQLAMELGLQIQVTAINKINQTNFERSKVHSDFKNIKAIL